MVEPLAYFLRVGKGWVIATCRDAEVNYWVEFYGHRPKDVHRHMGTREQLGKPNQVSETMVYEDAVLLTTWLLDVFHDRNPLSHELKELYGGIVADMRSLRDVRVVK